MLCKAIVVAAVAFGASADQEQFQHLALVQQHSMLHSRVDLNGTSRGIGSMAPTTEQGYQMVAALKSDEEMRSFIHRVVQNEARYVKDPAELSGILPYYSGSQAVQSLETLKKELRASAWIAEGEGRSAPLNEAGYAKVAALKSRPHMMAFARRILDSDKRKCLDEGALIGMISYYDGEVAIQTFDHLQTELLSASWAPPRDSILAPETPPVALQEQEVAVQEGGQLGVGNQATLRGDSEDDLMKEGFDRIDGDHDGFLSEEELSRYMASLDQAYSDEKVADMLTEADLDGDGQISNEEFLKVMG